MSENHVRRKGCVAIKERSSRKPRTKQQTPTPFPGPRLSSPEGRHEQETSSTKHPRLAYTPKQCLRCVSFAPRCFSRI